MLGDDAGDVVVSLVHNCKSAPCLVCGSEDGSGNPLTDDRERLRALIENLAGRTPGYAADIDAAAEADRIIEAVAQALFFRDVQYAANMLGLTDFVIALDLDVDDYSREKFKEFQSLGLGGHFDDTTLRTLVEAYYAKVRRAEAEERARAEAEAAAEAEPVSLWYVGQIVEYRTKSKMPGNGWRTGTVLQVGEGDMEGWIKIEKQQMSPYKPGWVWVRTGTLRLPETSH